MVNLGVLEKEGVWKVGLCHALIKSSARVSNEHTRLELILKATASKEAQDCMIIMGIKLPSLQQSVSFGVRS